LTVTVAFPRDGIWPSPATGAARTKFASRRLTLGVGS
jgi:hypothetical protein